MINRTLPFLFLICCINCGQSAKKDVPFGIVSLSPSITRGIIDLGAEDLLVGVTSYHPPLSRKIESVGSLNLPNLEKILFLKPQLVLFSEEDAATQRLEGLKASGLYLHGFSRNTNFYDICANYIELGKIIGRDSEAERKAALYMDAISKLKKNSNEISLLVLISHEPLITASGMSFVGKIINDAGGRNVFADAPRPYPIVSIESIISKSPDAVIIMSNGGVEYFQKKFGVFSMKALKNNNVFKIEPEHIAYYTPSDYVAAVKDFISILDSVKL
ncbi:MAG: helical backbone metal receptor [Leptospirales bacterium]|nr:helical backbone metal receptor [Leptospirales bacterium]